MEKCLILGLGKGIQKISLEHFVVPESNEVFKKGRGNIKVTDGANLKEIPMAKIKQVEQESK